MNDEIIKINKLNKSITFINNGIVFSQFGVADEILDLITNLQNENEELKQDNIIGCKKFIKQRQIIDKAIEWVKEHIETYQKNEIVILDWDNFSDPRNLLKILKGSDEE